MEALTQNLIARCNELSTGRRVLAIEDTTQFNFTHHSGKIRPGELGAVGTGNELGFLLHPVLIMDTETKAALGYGDIHVWTREPGGPPSTQKMPIEQKESYRWIECAERTKENIQSAAQIIVVTDREGDIYELLNRVPDKRTDIVVRVCYDRCLADQKKSLYAYLDEIPVQGSYELDLGKTHQRSKHRALMEVKFAKVSILKPRNRSLPDQNSVELHVVEVREHPSTVVKGEQPVLWRLYTTCLVQDFDTACEIIEWYVLRWQIEQLFRALKSKGLDFEASQLETEAGLNKLLIMAMEVALKVIQLTHARDGTSNCDVRLAFTKQQIALIEALIPKYEGKTQKQKNPFPKMSLARAGWLIARAGGWKGYKSESPPGPITFKRGLQKFYNIFAAYQLLLSSDVCIE